ncbi:MAG TPA: hypothetical protein VGU72_04265 [Beijerinckiaceae bacterium]|nr:hypothetical protein [Beijerinckiaceae bacterium]
MQTTAIKSWVMQVGPGDVIKACSVLLSAGAMILTGMSWAGDIKRDIVNAQTAITLMQGNEKINAQALEALKSSQLLQANQITELKEAARDGRQANSRVEQQLVTIREMLADLRARVPAAPQTLQR